MFDDSGETSCLSRRAPAGPAGRCWMWCWKSRAGPSRSTCCSGGCGCPAGEKEKVKNASKDKNVQGRLRVVRWCLKNRNEYTKCVQDQVIWHIGSASDSNPIVPASNPAWQT
jgi:hypothetical protein